MKAILLKEYGLPDIFKIGEVAKQIPAGNEELVRNRRFTCRIYFTELSEYTPDLSS